MKFKLKQYDNILLTFEYVDKGLDGKYCEIIDINKEKEYLLPKGLEVSNDGLMAWLKRRVIPRNREFVDNLLSKMGLSQQDTMGIIRICKGLSITDCYWIVEENFEGLFKDYNLYENKFETALSLVAYVGYGSAKAKGFSSSPEFTTNGMLKKAWRRLGDGKIYLYKGGTSGGINTGKEPYSEFYACQIADKLCLNYVDYGLAKWKGTLCSTCELFTSLEYSYVPIYEFVKNMPLKKVGEYLKKLGQDYYNSFVDMLIFDAIICNTDRHYGNFGFLVDNKTNKPVAFAPIFDNGLSLFNYAMDEDLENIEKYAATRVSSYGIPFLYVVKEFITDRQRDKLKSIRNFTFEKHKSYNLSAKRLKNIEKFINIRREEILEIK